MREKYLDGLRGWAALFVLLGHIGPNFLFATYPLPILPVFFDAQLAVYVFFVLSGYVLSIEFFRTGRKKAVLDLAIRRYPRLTLPILVSCLIAYVMLKFDLFSNLAAADLAKSGWLKLFYTFEPSFIDFLRFSLWDVYVKFSNERYYNAVLWTMPYEMAGSLIIFGLLLLSGRSAYIQVGLIGSFILLAAWSNSPFLAFALGMALAYVGSRYRYVNNKKSVSRTIASSLILLLSTGSTMLSLPSRDPVVPSIASAAILLSILINQPLQKWLSGRLSLWLGAISFPLYLTHLLIICSVSSFLYIVLIGPNHGAIPELTLIAVVTIALCLGAANLYRPVERLSVKIGRAFALMVWRAIPLKVQPAPQ